MIATAIRTRKVTAGACSITDLLDKSLSELSERSVLVVTSKIVSLCEGRVKPLEGTDLPKLVLDEAEWYLPEGSVQHGYTFTIAHNMVTPNSGIDESNAKGVYVLWPEDPQASANRIRSYLVDRFKLKEVAVIIVDSTFLPLRWGSVGLSLAYSGIEPLRRYVGQEDLFGRILRVSRSNVVDSLAATATLLMGEGAEQTPLTVIQDVPNITFVPRDPTSEEIASRHTPPHEDMFGDILTAVHWERGGKGGSADVEKT
ncbi:MAG TPA: coenzyme F420-0:L-glutamate ligase [Candidatus Saccharimonadales bacterium]